MVWLAWTDWTDWLGRFTVGTIQSAPFKLVYVFSSRWRFGFDLQGTEMNMNLFKRKTTLQKAARVPRSTPHNVLLFLVPGKKKIEDLKDSS